MRSSAKEIKNFNSNIKKFEELEKKKDLSINERLELINLKFEIKTLINCFELLDNREMDFIKLRMQGLTFGEIAALKNISVSGAGLIVSKAIERIDNILNHSRNL